MTTKVVLDAQEVRKRIDVVKRLLWDIDRAHGMEDTLYRELLEMAARGVDTKDLAGQALETQNIIKVRWYG